MKVVASGRLLPLRWRVSSLASHAPQVEVEAAQVPTTLSMLLNTSIRFHWPAPLSPSQPLPRAEMLGKSDFPCHSLPFPALLPSLSAPQNANLLLLQQPLDANAPL